ncbi:tigger transposable element-derived protein 2-like [Anoplophora glabripennis]|uniref:tigger transposable element-derived protein 2-like n=1 Tax=Anoplophora glabripennis TaxID=217634 RepID=UPI0008740FE0|nr:tigger transposable element-derived protein 2-like [Anoplophora glabripennis]
MVPTPKRKHKTLSIAEKCAILDSLKDGVSETSLALKYGVGKSTITDLRKKEQKIRSFVAQTEKGPGLRKTLKLPENPVLEEALFTWFLEQRRRHVPLSGEIVMHKARFFHKKLTGSDFSASRGWLDNFKKRHGIRQLKVSGEKVSSNAEAVQPFQEKFLKEIREKDLCPEQIYNADESGLFWKVLPDKTLASSAETSASGSKVSKERITFMPCANSIGNHKLQLLVVGKAKKPRSFGSVKLPVHYQGQMRAWVTRDIFLEWFREHFVPEVKRHLKKLRLPQRALLLLDNAPGHPDAEDLTTEDGNFSVLYMPPNCTPLIQPMDQNVIQNVKINYKKKLLIQVFAQQEDDESLTLHDVIKSITIKDAIFSLAQCWDHVSSSLIKKSWKPLWPDQFNEAENGSEENDGSDVEDNLPLSLLRNRGYTEETISTFLTISEAENCTEPITDDEIIAQLRQETDELFVDNTSVLNVEKIPHSQAISALNTCLDWADVNDFSLSEDAAKFEGQSLSLVNK